jgi:hypothetical protein
MPLRQQTWLGRLCQISKTLRVRFFPFIPPYHFGQLSLSFNQYYTLHRPLRLTTHNVRWSWLILVLEIRLFQGNFNQTPRHFYNEITAAAFCGGAVPYH